MSKQNYCTVAEVLDITGVTVTDDQISQAEKMIDDYVGPQGQKHLITELIEKASAAASGSISLASGTGSIYNSGYFVGKSIEIIGGTGMGQRRSITASNGDLLTISPNWETTPDTTSVYHIWQPGKFPRTSDVKNFNGVLYPGIPEGVKKAVAYQTVWLQNNDDLDEETKQSENIGGYSYSRGSASGRARLISPKARQALRGITNRTGQFK